MKNKTKPSSALEGNCHPLESDLLIFTFSKSRRMVVELLEMQKIHYQTKLEALEFVL